VRIAIVGYGRMGHEVERLALAAGDEVVARLGRGDPIEPSSLAGAEVAVEFTVPDAAPDTLVALAGAGVDVACGTTGWLEALPRVRAAVEAAGTGLVHAPNFSLGVAIFSRLVREAARALDVLPEYDLELHETHHRHKLDHPSGTARALADLVVGEVRRKTGWSEVPTEAAGSGSPELGPETLRVTVTRSGDVPGTHVLGIDGPDDRLELRHEALGRSGFARGALDAARWIRGRRGVFTLEAYLADRFRA
jgi:4-hydroxy-tetrahydrodipicolinate reductase